MEWLFGCKKRTPILETAENRIGLGFLAVAYGVVLGFVFEFVHENYDRVRGPGWSQLALATAAIVVSWIGLFNNRSTYPNWRARFVNVPFVQFLVSVAILVGYWGLIATAEGIPGAVNADSKPSIVPEALLLTLIFASYLLWDALEWSVLCSKKYHCALYRQGPDLFASIHKLTTRAKGFFAVTLGFTIVFGAAYLIADCAGHAQSALSVELLDATGIALLFLYRMMHERVAGDEPPTKPVAATGEWSTLSNDAALAAFASIARQPGRGDIVGSYVDAAGVRHGFVVPGETPAVPSAPPAAARD